MSAVAHNGRGLNHQHHQLHHPPPAAPPNPQTSSSQQTRRVSSSGAFASRAARTGPTPVAHSAHQSTSAVMPSHPGSSGSAFAQYHQPPPPSRASDVANGHTNGVYDDDTDQDGDRRPSSAPGNKHRLSIATSFDDSDRDQPRRRPKPPLLRSKSEHFPRNEEAELSDDEVYEWSARHGFEDHYQSEDIISQLANVSYYSPLWMNPRATVFHGDNMP